MSSARYGRAIYQMASASTAQRSHVQNVVEQEKHVEQRKRSLQERPSYTALRYSEFNRRCVQKHVPPNIDERHATRDARWCAC